MPLVIPNKLPPTPKEKAGNTINDVVKATCTKCGHKEQMFEVFWQEGPKKCLDCGGDLHKDSERKEPTEFTKGLMALAARR